METKVEKLKESRIKTITILTADERKQAEDDALKSLARQVRIKGFREGMAPPELVRAQIKPEQLNEEIVRMAIPRVATDALKISSAKPIIRPSATIVSLDPLTISLVFVEKPEAELKKPDSIKVEKKKIEPVSTKDTEDFIHKLLLQDRTETPVDRAAAKGDLVKVALATKDKSGAEVKELTVGHYGLELGSDELLPELESHVTGMKKDEKKSVEIDFPKTHDIPALQGKKLTVEILNKGVAETKLPELTADYIKSRLGADRTPDAFRKEVEQMLTNQKRSEEMKRREEELYQNVRSAVKIGIAPELIDAETQEMLVDLQERLKRQEMTLEQWMESTGKKPQQVIDEMKGVATDRITLRFGMQLLAEHKKIEPDAADMQKAIEGERAHAKDHGHPLEEKDLQPGGNFYEQAKWELTMQKLVASLIEDEKSK